MTERLRNHPSYIVRMLVTGGVLAALMCFTLPPETEWMRYVLAASVFAVFAVLGIGIWACSWLTMYEDHAVSEVNFIVKKTTVIPYAKVASANLVRNIFDRVFGTSNIRVNVNSAVNSAKAEVSFVLKKEDAERIRTILTTGMFGDSPPATEEESEASGTEDEIEGEKVGFTYLDSFLYGFLGGGTASTLWTILLLAYSVYTGILADGVSLFPLLLLFFTTGIQIVSSIIRYCNFVLVRNGDRLHIHHGLTRTYDTEFEARRINAFRIRRPLFMRLIGRCTVEVEVVGINAMENTVTPVVGLMVRERDLDSFMERFVPELPADIPVSGVPREARVPLACRGLLFAVPSALVMLLVCWSLSLIVPEDDIDALVIKTIMYIAGLLAFLLPAYIGVCTVINYRICRFGTDRDMFRVVRGAVDREVVTIQYDRVQVFTTSASPSARRHGVSRADIEFLSSAGGKKLTTGYFHAEDLENIQKTMLVRLESGEYDYRTTEI